MSRIRTVLILAALAASSTVTTAQADTPLGPADYVPCPGITGDGSKYQGAAAPYRCHSAVVDPLGNVVILRQGRSDGSGASGFGWLHVQQDHNLDDTAIERVVSTAYPLTAPHGRKRYIADYRVADNDMISIWIETDPDESKDAPDDEPFGVVTGYCKYPANGNPEKLCPNWVDESM